MSEKRSARRPSRERRSVVVHIEVRYESADRIFIAEASDLGCWASGATEEQAVTALIDVIRDYFVTFLDAAPDLIDIQPEQEEDAPAVAVSRRELLVATG